MKQRGTKEEKELKEMKVTSETSGTMSMPNIEIIGVPEEEDTKKGHEKIFEETIVENFPKWERK